MSINADQFNLMSSTGATGPALSAAARAGVTKMTVLVAAPAIRERTKAGLRRPRQAH